MSCLTCRPPMVFATVALWNLALASASMNHADEEGQNHIPHRMFVLQINGDSSPMSRSPSLCVSDCESSSPVVAFSALLLLVASLVGMAIMKKRNKKMTQHTNSYSLPPSWWNKRNFVELKDDDCNVDPPTKNSNVKIPKQGKVLPIQVRSNTFTMDENYKNLSDPVHSMDSLVGSDPEDNDDDEDTIAVSNVYRASKHAFGEHLNFLRRQIILPTPAKTVAPAPNAIHENIRFKGTLVEV